MKYDVVVVGGGPAGVAAAIEAAKNGAKTLLIEKEGYLGGMGTSAMVPALGPCLEDDKYLVGGTAKKIYDTLVQKNTVPLGADIRWYPIDTEYMKRLLDKLVIESGCDILLHTWVYKVLVENDSISSIQCVGKKGSFEVFSDIFIDCTGDADIVALAGGEFEYGDDNSQVQSPTLCFKIANFDTDTFMKYKKESGEDGNLSLCVKKAKKNNDFPMDELKVCGMAQPCDGVCSFNFGHVYNINPLDSFSITNAEIEARRKLPILMNFIKKYVPGAQDAVLVSSGPNIGIRESRRIVGLYRLTGDDHKNRRDFDDGITYYNYSMDFHSSTGQSGKEMEELYKATKYEKGERYAIPYRSLVPIKLKNILVAGRCISSDRDMNSAIRLMPTCFSMGDAAGVAASICIKEAILPRDVDTKLLRKKLFELNIIF